MNNEPLAHLWIPDEEAHKITKDLTSRSNSRNISYREHGFKLSRSLQQIKGDIDKLGENNSLIDSGIIVFDVELFEGEKIQHKEEDLFVPNGMTINAVRGERNAIVTTTPVQYQKLNERIEAYANNGTYRTSFENVESLTSYTGRTKDSKALKRSIIIEEPPVSIDLQLMLLPNLDRNIYQSVIDKITNRIKDTHGKIEAIYYLSDDTPIIRVIVPSVTLSGFENDPAVYRIEETSFLLLTPVQKKQWI